MRQAGRWIDRVDPSFSAKVEDKDLAVNRAKVLVATNDIEPIAHFGAGSIKQRAGAFWAPRPTQTDHSMLNALCDSVTLNPCDEPRAWRPILEQGQNSRAKFGVPLQQQPQAPRKLY